MRRLDKDKGKPIVKTVPRITKDEFNQLLREGRVTVSETSVPARDPIQSPNPERVVQDEPLGKKAGAAQVSAPVHVRVTSRRKRIADPDHAVCSKYVVDSLRYAGIIKGDSAKDITFDLIQEKADCYETIVEVFDRKP